MKTISTKSFPVVIGKSIQILLAFLFIYSTAKAYDPNAAAIYADMWTNECPPGSIGCDPAFHNNAYPYYPSNDCANYVSQCLIAGGLNLIAGPGCVNGTIAACNDLHVNLSTHQNTYWQIIMNPGGYPSSSQFTKGDVVMFGSPSDFWEHAAINVVSGTPALDAHTNNRYHKTVSFFYPSTSWDRAYFYHFNSITPPSNDNCSAAINITACPGTSCCGATTGNISGATQSISPISCSGYLSTMAQDVWYKFTATSTSHTITVTPSSGLDAVIDLRSGSCNGTNIACSDNAGGDGVTEILTYSNFIVGNTYYVRVYDYTGSSIPPTTTSFTICVTSNIPCIAVSISSQPQNQTVCSNNTATFCVSVNGTGPFLYFWYNQNGQITGANSSCYTTPILSASNNGNYYYCTVTNCNSTNQAISNNAYLTVNTTPSQPSSISGNNSVCQNSSQTYSINSVPGATSYTWNLLPGWSGSSTSTSINTTVGSFGGTISVTANNTCGNSATRTISVTLNSVPSTPVITPAGSLTVCSGIPTTLSVQSPENGVSYYWSNDGVIGNTHTVTDFNGGLYCYAYNTCGNSNNSNTVSISLISVPQEVSASASQTTVCSGSTFMLNGNAIGATSWNWSGPGGFSSTSQNTSATATTSGTYTLIATNSCGSSSANTAYVNVITSPTGVSASTSPATLCIGNPIALNGNAIGATSWNWSGPGSFSSTSQNASATATTSGTYTLTATNSCGSNSASTAYVNVTTPPTGVTASASPTLICSGNTVMLTGNATGATSWNWSGPNGFSSASQNASATATTSGTYTLTATNSCGSTSASTSYVNVSTPPTGITASASQSTLCSGNTISLIGNANGATSWNWSGPNGFNSALQNVSAIATTSGTYTLTATNSCGSNSATSAYVNVITAPTGVSASASPTTVCSGSSIALNGNATGATSWNWSGPNGFNSALQNVSAIATTSGTYTLTATNSCGSNSTTSAYVNVITAPTGVTASASPIIVCLGNSITLNGNATGATSWNWSGPNGFNSALQNTSATSTTSGTYTLTATNSCGSTSATSVYVTVNTAPNQPSAISGESVVNVIQDEIYSINSVVGATNYDWSITNGDSITSLNDTTIVVHWNTVGSDTVYVSSFNDCGESNRQSLAILVTTSIVENSSSSSIRVFPNPTSGDFTIEFNQSKKQHCTLEIFNALGEVVYSDESKNPSNNLTQNFHLNEKAGIYFVRISDGENKYIQKLIIQ
jgi:PKD repeat protein